jgi:hypothetical protein
VYVCTLRVYGVLVSMITFVSYRLVNKCYYSFFALSSTLYFVRVGLATPGFNAFQHFHLLLRGGGGAYVILLHKSVSGLLINAVCIL